ncbi:unnamed protein product [Fraxinus pennsylvanica]|uniref:Pentatricopeptide repeat-containing protein n=1 Tax=Fraxinus pennsylvanica TaxID=56036 RepID=A0AAD2A6D7_9LAMI|nr:unnamed protein product [Fraxinus pennsylvanica]
MTALSVDMVSREAAPSVEAMYRGVGAWAAREDGGDEDCKHEEVTYVVYGRKCINHGFTLRAAITFYTVCAIIFMSAIALSLRTLIFPTPLSVFRKLCSSSPVHLDHLFSSNTNLCSTFHTFDPETYYTSLLEKSVIKIHLNQIHAQLYTNGLQNNGFIIAKFIHVSSNLREISYAHKVFDEFQDPYVFLWNAIIKGYSVHDMFANAIEMYTRMQYAYVNPDSFTFPHVLKACGGLMAVGIGSAVHAQSFRLGFEDDVFVQNGLVAFYVKCNKICCAEWAAYGGLEDFQ